MAISILRFDMRAPDFSPATPRELYAAALEMAAWADRQGFDSITLSEHHGVADGFLPSPLSLAGCMVGCTERIRFSVGALLLPLYNPVRLAEDLAVLDLASGGRVGLTAGIGYRPEEYEMVGVDWASRGARMDECLDVLIRAWTGEAFEYDGRRVQLTPRPLTQPLPPVMVGGMGRKGALRAARFGLPFQPGVNTPEVIELYYAECEKRGVAEPMALPPGPGEMLWISVDPERTWSQIGPHLLHDATTYAGWQPAGQRSTVHSDARSVEALRSEGKYLVLTPDEAIARMEAQGAHAVSILFPLCGGTPPALAWESLELFASDVLPRIR